MIPADRLLREGTRQGSPRQVRYCPSRPFAAKVIVHQII